MYQIPISYFYQPVLSFAISQDDHHHDDEEEEGGGSQEAAEDDNAPKSTFKVDEIIPIVDSILEQDDKVSTNPIHPFITIIPTVDNILKQDEQGELQPKSSIHPNHPKC